MKNNDVIYYGLFLDDRYRMRLMDNVVEGLKNTDFEHFGGEYYGFNHIDKYYLDHVTLAFNTQFKDNPDVVEFCEANLGKQVAVCVTDFGFNDTAIAFKVYLGNDIPCANATPHITIATKNGGRPVDSNKITDWNPLGRAVPFMATVGAYRRKK